MVDKKNPWPDEAKAIRATQLAFDLSGEVQTLIKQEALANLLNPPDQIRKILGLSYNKRPVRPRLTVSLREEDFQVLAERYGLHPTDQNAIRDRAIRELVEHALEFKAEAKS